MCACVSCQGSPYQKFNFVKVSMYPRRAPPAPCVGAFSSYLIWPHTLCQALILEFGHRNKGIVRVAYPYCLHAVLHDRVPLSTLQPTFPTHYPPTTPSPLSLYLYSRVPRCHSTKSRLSLVCTLPSALLVQCWCTTTAAPTAVLLPLTLTLPSPTPHTQTPHPEVWPIPPHCRR